MSKDFKIALSFAVGSIAVYILGFVLMLRTHLGDGQGTTIEKKVIT